MAKVTRKVQVTVPKVDRVARLCSFDEATARQEPRNRAGRRARRAGRGWTREELYDRARPR